MPWYYKKHGEFGKKNVSQVTRKWFREAKLKKLEIDGEARLKRMERKAKAVEETHSKVVQRIHLHSIQHQCHKMMGH